VCLCDQDAPNIHKNSTNSLCRFGKFKEQGTLKTIIVGHAQLLALYFERLGVLMTNWRKDSDEELVIHVDPVYSDGYENLVRIIYGAELSLSIMEWSRVFYVARYELFAWVVECFREDWKLADDLSYHSVARWAWTLENKIGFLFAMKDDPCLQGKSVEEAIAIVLCIIKHMEVNIINLPCYR
jgi:hypothetical protein